MRKLSGLIGLSVLAMVAGCASDTDRTPGTGSELSNQNAVDRLEQDIAPLVGTCVLTAVGTSATLKTAVIEIDAAGEAIIVAKRAVDGMFVVNGNLCVTDKGAVSATLAANVTALEITGSVEPDVVILDFTAGTFAPRAATGTNGITVDLGDESDTLAIKGTNLADNVTYGQATVAADGSGYVSFNAATVVNKLHDIEYVGIEHHLASLGAGNDSYTLAPFNTGSAEIMSVFGGAGDDTFNQGTASTPNETIFGGDGLDTVTYTGRTAAVAYDYVVDAAANDGEATSISALGVVVSKEKDNIMGDVETVIAGSGNDLLRAPAAAIVIDSKTNITHRLIGGTGDDKLYGGLGPDYLDGGAGADILYDNVTQADSKDVANGADTYIGGDGTDTMDYSLRIGAISVTMSGAAVSGATGELDKVDLTVENLIGGAGADTLIGNTLDNVIDGGAANDTISGLTGTDTVDYSNRTNAVTVSLATANTLSGDSTDLVSGKGDAVNITDIENVIGSETADNTITGNANDNEITGGEAIDTISSGAGNDIIDMGGDGVDVIVCGDDMDMIVNASAAVGVDIDVSCDIVF